MDWFDNEHFLAGDVLDWEKYGLKYQDIRDTYWDFQTKPNLSYRREVFDG